MTGLDGLERRTGWTAWTHGLDKQEDWMDGPDWMHGRTGWTDWADRLDGQDRRTVDWRDRRTGQMGGLDGQTELDGLTGPTN